MLRFAIAALLLGSGPAFAQTSAADCATPAPPVEQAICRDPELARLDRQVRDAFVRASGRVDRDALAALRKDQKDFMAERAMIFDKGAMPLSDYLRNRAAFLDSLENARWGRDAAAFIGTWRSSLGEVRIAPDADGRLAVSISTLSPAETRWICDIESTAEARNGRLEFTEDEVRVTLVRRGSALVVGDQLPQGDGGRPFCGANGYIDGAYFKVKPAEAAAR